MLNYRGLGSAVFLVGAAALLGCSGDPETNSVSVCDNFETPYDTIAPDLMKVGQAQNLKVRLVATSPSPPERGSNSWQVELLGMNDQPMPSAAVVGAKPWMPDHGHGTAVEVALGATDASGVVMLDDIDFRMVGVWTLALDVADGPLNDTVTFGICID